MAAQVMDILATTFTQVVAWFDLILTESGFSGLFLSAFFLYLLGRFLLKPIFGSAGSAGSDRARKDDDE